MKKGKVIIKMHSTPAISWCHNRWGSTCWLPTGDRPARCSSRSRASCPCQSHRPKAASNYMFEQQIWGYNTGYLHIKQDWCLGDNSSLLGLLLMVSLQPLLGDPLLLLRLLFVTENKSKINNPAFLRATNLDPKRSTSSSSSAAAGAAPPPRENPELALGNCFIPVPKDLMWLYLKQESMTYLRFVLLFL